MAELEEGEGNTSKEHHMYFSILAFFCYIYLIVLSCWKKKIKMGYEKKPIKLADDLIFLILARLPAKSLIRFSSVCESWNVLVKKDRFFATQHINTQSKPAIVGFTCNNQAYEEFTLNYGYGSELHTVFSSMSDLKVESMTNSCDGLVGIYNPERFWLVNPSIKKIAQLPRGSPHIDIKSPLIDSTGAMFPSRADLPAAAIGCDTSTGDYKVVRIFHRGNKSFGCEMFSLNNGTWKSLNDPPRLYYYSGFLPVTANGFIYWTVKPIDVRLIDDLTGVVMSPEISVCFNMREETFGIVLHPLRDKRPIISKLVNLGENICAADASDSAVRMTIWQLKDHLKSDWVKLYEIDTTKKTLEPIITDNGRMILYDLCDTMEAITMDNGRIVFEDSGWMHYYDPKTMSFVKQEEIGKYGFFAPCAESVVWPY